MTTLLDPPLTPRNGCVLRGLLICRVSDPENGSILLTKKKRRRRRPRRRQDERSLDDQEAMLRDWVAKHTDLPCELAVIAGTGSGEWPDREEVRKTEQAIKSERYDFIVCEDLGRIVRRQKAFGICELAEDHAVRIFALGDGLDTADRKGWRLHAYFAAFRHEMHNADLRDRIRRSHRNRFKHGNVFPCEVYGYNVQDIDITAPINDADVTKDPAAEPIYREWFERLDRGESFSAVADWLNTTGVPTGPYCRLDRWDCRMVGRVTRNPILKGVRVRNARMAKRINSTGRSKSIKAPPDERLERECPHLAFITPDEYDRILAKVNVRNAIYRRGKNGIDSRANISRKRTRFPGQTAYCGICGRMFVFGGHGQTDHLMCDGARHYWCWNGATIDGPLAAMRIAAAVSREIESLPEFDDAWCSLLNEEAKRVNETLDQEVAGVRIQLVQCEAAATNLIQYLKNGAQSEIVANELRSVEQEIARLKIAVMEAERSRPRSVVLPTANELRALYRASFSDLAVDSYEFASALRQLVPRLVVLPYRRADGGKVVLRARFRLQLASLVPELGARSVLKNALERVLEVDLFDRPQREVYRVQIMVMLQAKRKQRCIAHQLGITQPIVQQAAALQRLMEERGLTDAYVPVTQPPDGDSKLRRHKHKRYRFEPLDGAGEL